MTSVTYFFFSILEGKKWSILPISSHAYFPRGGDHRGRLESAQTLLGTLASKNVVTHRLMNAYFFFLSRAQTLGFLSPGL